MITDDLEDRIRRVILRTLAPTPPAIRPSRSPWASRQAKGFESAT